MASDRRLVRLADRGVEEIKGVGKKSAQSLREIGIETVLDLITFYPRRYIDRTNSLTIAELTEGTDAMVLANVARVQSTRTRNRRSLVQVDIADESGSLRCSFFNQAWRARQLVEGSEVIVAGKVTSFKGRPQMSNPTVDIVGKPGHRRTGRIVPIYPQSEKAGISTWDMELWIAEAIRRSGDFSDPLPAKWRRKLNLLDRTDAIRCIHFPADDGSRFAARRRIVIDEMLRLQLVLVERKRDLELSVAGIAHSTGAGESTAVVPGLLQELLRSLPFELTGGQTRAISEVCEDMAMAHPMHRLIQGDVGAGKTLVAVAALVASAQGGHQGAILVPTEVLAEQHATGIRALVEDLEMPDPARITGSRGFRVELLTSNTSATQRNTILRDLKSGLVDAVVGTHALLSEGVEFASLGVIIVDEQHRFGVEQRDALRSRRSDRRVPDLLVMTATPIPRTVAMTV
ncbi:MAG TPA: DEAD/DEAH box helicase, partial [Acidimicrobiales bacterium]|nr:DEAD/DEAH box helicase [Acidimicrobiales bacterium]